MPGIYFTSAPDGEEAFEVGNRVEVYCDHEIDGDRISDWLVGTVVQVDTKLVAVQFQESVYLTDGWMIPDHVLWCPKDSHKIRFLRRRRKSRRTRKN